MIQAVVFDMDGLLVNTERICMEICFDVAREMGYAMTWDIYRSLLGVRDDEAHQICRQHFPGFDQKTYSKAVHAAFVQQIEAGALQAKKGAAALLNTLSDQAFPYALATSSSYSWVEYVLNRAGLLHFFDHIISGETVSRSKPAPDIFLAAANRLHCSPHVCLALEDSLKGMQAGKAAGMTVCMIPDLIPYQEAYAPYCDHVFQDLSEVCSLLEISKKAEHTTLGEMDMSDSTKQAILGIDVGGTKVSCGLIRADGTILETEKFPVPRHRLDSLFSSSCEILDRMLIHCDAYGLQPVGIGIAMRGYIDAEKNQLVFSTLFHDAASFDLCGHLTKKYALPVRIDNDVHAAALAEKQWGAGRETDCLTYINVGTGLAIGVIEHGKLLRGLRNTSGELGGSIYRRAEDGERCTLEEIVSGYGIQREARRLLSQFPDSVLAKDDIYETGGGVRAIFEAAKEGDALANHVINQAAMALAEAIFNIEFIANSSLYVLGGGVMNQHLFLERLQEELTSLQKQKQASVSIRLQLSSLGANDAGLLGAASLIL